MAGLKYKRVLLKVSGEMFGDVGIDGKALVAFAKEIKHVKKLGCQIGIVVGGGNIWRFRDHKDLELGRVTSDMMGMVATVMNAVAFVDALKSVGVKAKGVSSLHCDEVIENYSKNNGRKYLDQGFVVVLAGGTGKPYFTTDTAAALKAVDLNCDVVFKATKVDYVYDKDPMKYKDVKKYLEMSFSEVLKKKLEVMDATCAEVLKKGNIPMLVFNMNKKGNLEKAVKGVKVGTLITS